MPESLDPCAAFLVFVVVAIAFVYGVSVWNDLSRRRARVVAMWALVQRAGARKQGVSGAASDRLDSATGHERRVARAGRGKFRLTWPATAAVGTANGAMSADVRSHDVEFDAWRAFLAAVQEYNERLSQFPRNIVAFLLGFRKWRYARAAGGRTRRRRRGR
jgi:hypothetical protein